MIAIHHMFMIRRQLILTLPAMLIWLQFVAGCGSAQNHNKNFYTSGSPEADQRADQRMAQAAQVKGQGEGVGEAAPNSAAKKSLYDRLGADAGIFAISDDFVTRVMADPRVNFVRKDIIHGGLGIHHSDSVQWDANPNNVKALKLHLAQFIALASGGPSKYEGQQMKESHAGLHITNDEFDASVGDMKATLDKLQIPNTEQKELLAIIETTRAQVVEER